MYVALSQARCEEHRERKTENNEELQEEVPALEDLQEQQAEASQDFGEEEGGQEDADEEGWEYAGISVLKMWEQGNDRWTLWPWLLPDAEEPA
eukprot:2787605-Heterocapsa_arctica.AAC.1